MHNIRRRHFRKLPQNTTLAFNHRWTRSEYVTLVMLIWFIFAPVTLTLIQWPWYDLAVLKMYLDIKILGGAKTSQTFNSTYTLWRKISFYPFVKQYVLLLIYKFQWHHHWHNWIEIAYFSVCWKTRKLV